MGLKVYTYMRSKATLPSGLPHRASPAWRRRLSDGSSSGPIVAVSQNYVYYWQLHCCLWQGIDQLACMVSGSAMDVFVHTCITPKKQLFDCADVVRDVWHNGYGGEHIGKFSAVSSSELNK